MPSHVDCLQQGDLVGDIFLSCSPCSLQPAGCSLDSLVPHSALSMFYKAHHSQCSEFNSPLKIVPSFGAARWVCEPHFPFRPCRYRLIEAAIPRFCYGVAPGELAATAALLADQPSVQCATSKRGGALLYRLSFLKIPSCTPAVSLVRGFRNMYHGRVSTSNSLTDCHGCRVLHASSTRGRATEEMGALLVRNRLPLC